MFDRVTPGIEARGRAVRDGPGSGRFQLAGLFPAGALGTLAVAVLLVLVGIATAIDPRLGLLVAVACVAAWLAADSSRASRLFLIGLAAILVGYAALDRGFAHLGVHPIYVGEIVLGAGVVAIIARADRLRLRVIHVLLAAFIGWGVLQTLPYFSAYGIDALRDGVTYGYAIIAFAILVCVGGDQIPRIIRAYARLIPLLLVWIPSAVLVSYLTPHAPGQPAPIAGLLDYKPGDAAVQLAGIAAFLLVGPDGSRRTGIVLREAGMWLLWLVGAAVASIFNRGGMLALASVAAILPFITSVRRWASLALTVTAVLSVLIVANPEVRLGEGTRTVSVGQVIANVSSVLFPSQDEALQGTKDFRLQWWGYVAGYTIGGPYFWTGKGFGVNLADADGFQVTADHSLRAPHNGHVEILARMGVPGLVLWVLLQVAFAAALLRAAFAARRAGAAEWMARFAWIFVYWLAMIINMSFDPYLQGPQGGIWFWAVFGFGLVLLEAWRRIEAGPGVQASSQRPVRGQG